MHELSVAIQLVESAEDAARAAAASRVAAVQVRIGALAGIAAEALQFAFSVAAAGTLLDGAQLDIREVPVIVHCPHCGDHELPNLQRWRCPICAAPTADVRAGRELELASIEVE